MKKVLFTRPFLGSIELTLKHHGYRGRFQDVINILNSQLYRRGILATTSQQDWNGAYRGAVMVTILPWKWIVNNPSIKKLGTKIRQTVQAQWARIGIDYLGWLKKYLNYGPYTSALIIKFYSRADLLKLASSLTKRRVSKLGRRFRATIEGYIQRVGWVLWVRG
jgi:hypothetical protein